MALVYKFLTVITIICFKFRHMHRIQIKIIWNKPFKAVTHWRISVLLQNILGLLLRFSQMSLKRGTTIAVTHLIQLLTKKQNWLRVFSILKSRSLFFNINKISKVATNNFAKCFFYTYAMNQKMIILSLVSTQPNNFNP